MRHTASAMLELPQNLAPLLRPEPHLDVLGTCDPWVVPADWLETTQQKMKALAEDPRGQGGVAPSGSWKPGTSGAVPFLWNLTTFLPSAIPVWAGSYASLGDLLLKPWLSDTYVPTEPKITYYVNSDDTWHLDLWWRQRDLGAEARIKALELTIECVAVFADVPQYAPRAATFTAMLHKVLDDPELRKLHEDAPWDTSPRPGASRSAPSRTPRPSPRGAAGPPSWCGRSAVSTPRTRCSATWSAGPSRSTR